MGGNLISVFGIITLSQKTPSILNSEMNNNLSFSFIDYFSDINIVSFSFAKTSLKL